MSKHRYCKRLGDTIEVLGKDNVLIVEAREILFMDFRDDDSDRNGCSGRITFRRHLPDAHNIVESIVVYGLDDEDEVFYDVLEEVFLSDEPEGPEKNHYGFTAERISHYGGIA